MTTPWPPILSPRTCWDYWGGCDPSGFDAALRTVAGVFGYGPDHVAVFLLASIIFPLSAVLFVDPVPSDVRDIVRRVLLAFAAVGVVGWAAGFTQQNGGALLVFILLLVFWVALVAAGKRAGELAQNLRGQEGQP